MKTAALITLGCAKNLVDSEVMLGRLVDAGWRFTDHLESADVIVINTCGFIKPARDEAEEAIQSALAEKKKNPKIKVIAAGCYVERYREDLKKNHPEIDTWLGVGEFADIVDAVEGRPTHFPSGPCYLFDNEAPRLLGIPENIRRLFPPLLLLRHTLDKGRLSIAKHGFHR